MPGDSTCAKHRRPELLAWGAHLKANQLTAASQGPISSRLLFSTPLHGFCRNMAKTWLHPIIIVSRDWMPIQFIVIKSLSGALFTSRKTSPFAFLSSLYSILSINCNDGILSVSEFNSIRHLAALRLLQEAFYSSNCLFGRT